MKTTEKPVKINRLVLKAINNGYDIDFKWNVLRSVRITLTHRKSGDVQDWDISNHDFTYGKLHTLYNSIKRRI